MKYVEAGFIRCEPRSFYLHTAESAYVYFTVFFTTPWAAPLFHLDHFASQSFQQSIQQHPVHIASRHRQQYRWSGYLGYLSPLITAAEPPSAATVCERIAT